MEDKYVGPVRPSFNLAEEPKGKNSKRLAAGNDNNGIVIDANKSGIEISAYYKGFNTPTKYAVLRKPVLISWEELNKIQDHINSSSKKKATFDRMEDDVDAKYLETLPVVTINDKKYYIDPDKRERRLVAKPWEVWRF